MDEKERCERKLFNAQRLMNALGAEQERWAQSIIDLGELLTVIIGDVLLASSFVSYVGPFNKQYRDDIIVKNFLPFFESNGIPKSADPNPLLVLTDDAEKAGWNQNSLPPDRVSTENGAILTNSERTTLMVDPQLQGITWIKSTYSANLKITRLTNKNIVKVIEFAVEGGEPVLIENMGDAVDAVIQPVYAKQIIKKGKSRYIKMGDKELNLHNDFQMFMHSKLANPHYPPEIQAECTLINFTVTENGLEDQLLSLVVKKERPDLAATKEELVQQQNEFKITLSNLEKGLLKQLQEAKGDLTENIELIESLEQSKKLSTEIKEKVEIAKATEVDINVSSEHYRPAANRGALVFFLMNELNKIHSYYKFSLDSFLIVVTRAIDLVAKKDREAKLAAKKAEEGGDDEEEGAEGEGEEGAEAKKEEAPAEVEEEEA
jgi:dynein heavy chain